MGQDEHLGAAAPAVARKPEDRFLSAPAALAAFDALERPVAKRKLPVWAAAAVASVIAIGGVAAYKIGETER